ncbi:glycoside hydrolase family 65 protein [Marinigracilibium pacificum]|uniref:Glycoside hydrolase family 65 protein n=1 Tax=Marinigracilibium pacificum TaxID=2729599 RepID=A0A848J690_9BACT|nr:glycoside hydrolase family 65 protein [Marinigracilibium pacificum]NMM49984.1 glycoside hydrolase family 65 protein [Marinigracilibium pacificum]
MKDYIIHDEWNIIEEGFDPELNRVSESIFSLGNGRMGQRANFEEQYSGDSLQGNYVAGVYYPDKTRVGWWKNGYPDYFAKVLNAANWVGINIWIDGEALDLAKAKVSDFRRVLNMKEGYLERSFVATLQNGNQVEVKATRFCSIVDDETGAIEYKITAKNFSAPIKIEPYIDFDVVNEDSNYDEKFWNSVDQSAFDGSAWVTASTKKTNFYVCSAMKFAVVHNGSELTLNPELVEKEKYASNIIESVINSGETVTIYKYAANISSENHKIDDLSSVANEQLAKVSSKGFDQMKKEQADAWANKWVESDVVIKGDVAAQQGIRFNIFQLNQTYTGEDPRLNIGPKGFTGEKYGGSTYWDTEAYCLPFYMSTSNSHVARNLLVYRYKHLQKAIENAEKLGFKNGAALYPMVTMNGEECHNEWEITFEEIHRNGAIAYAIYDYTRYTGDKSYLGEYGLEVLIGISRFWAQRVNWSEAKQKYVMLGVTGPNEYENNVNNNWYTNYIAAWTLRYTLESMDYVKENNPEDLKRISGAVNFDFDKETQNWKKIIDNMYYPYDEERKVYLQQDGFLDKELIQVKDLAKEDRPINQNWSWDRILRSCFIKQADVLQGLYFFEDEFTEDEIRRNFEFYEPMTVHESSLSPCVHSILASKLGMEDKAYEMYLRTARLDLDDYNNDTEDGCHTTSMAGTWMAVVKGFGGMDIKDEKLHLNPFLPSKWQGYSFKINYRDVVLKVDVSKHGVEVTNESGEDLDIIFKGSPITVEGKAKKEMAF